MPKIERIVPKTYIVIKLQPLCDLLFPGCIQTMNYWIDKDTKEEYVRITQPYDVTEGSVHFDVCVSADSNVALVDDVMKALKRRFG